MLVFIASGVIEQHPRRKAEDAYDFHKWEPAARFLFCGLRVGALVLGSVRHAYGSAIDHPHTEAFPKLLASAGVAGGRPTQKGTDVPWPPSGARGVGSRIVASV